MKNWTLSITITAALIAATFIGCAHGTSTKSVEILESKLTELEAQVEKLTTANDHLCGALAESSMMGMLQYIGEGKFIVTATGQVSEAEGFLDDCNNAMRQYTEEIEKRKALVKAKEELKAKEAQETATACTMSEATGTGEDSCSCGEACECGDACDASEDDKVVKGETTTTSTTAAP